MGDTFSNILAVILALCGGALCWWLRKRAQSKGDRNL